MAVQSDPDRFETNMGNFILNPIGTAGDIHPYMAVAKELLSRGHKVQFLATPNYETLVKSEGIPFEGIGEPLDYSAIAMDDRLRSPYTAWKATIQWAATGMMKEVYEKMERLHVPEETVLVSPPWSLGARIAREVLPVSQVTLVLNPCLLRSSERPPILPMMPTYDWLPTFVKKIQYWIADRFVLDPLLLPELNSFRKELRLKPVSRVMNHWWFSTDRVLGLFGETMVPRAKDWSVPIELVGHTLWDPPTKPDIQSKLDRFMEEHSNPVAVVLGSVGTGCDQLIPMIIDACHQVERPCVLFSQLLDSIPTNLPSHVHHCPYAPLSEVLDRCSLILHSGCIGTTSQGLAAGLPQLVIPRVNDQFDNAARLIRMGVAKVIHAKRVTPNSLVSALREILDRDSIRAQAESLMSLHSDSSTHLVVDRLEEIYRNPPYRNALTQGAAVTARRLGEAPIER